MWEELRLESGSCAELQADVVTSCVNSEQAPKFSQPGLAHLQMLFQLKLPESNSEVHIISRSEEKACKMIDFVYPMVDTVSTLFNKMPHLTPWHDTFLVLTDWEMETKRFVKGL